jgi:hypothetical protein
VSTPSERVSSQGSGRAGRSRRRPQRESAIRSGETCVLVEVELRGPARNALFSHLGSLTERHGMTIYRHGLLSPGKGRLRVSVGVPRAHTPREAEEVVASLLERIGRTRQASATALIPD